MALRIDAGQGFGALLLLLLVTLTVAGLAVGFLSDHHGPGERTRARASRVLFGALAIVPAVAILLLANAPGGIDGQVSKAWHQATDPAVSGPSNSPERLTATSSGRARYWREALKVHAQAPWLGTGAGSYGTLRLRYRVDARTVRHAHGYVVQTLADLGWVGLGAVAAGRRRLARRRRAHGRGAPARPRRPLGRRTRRPRLAGRGRDRLRPALGDRLDVVRPRQRRCRRCCAPAGSRRARRCASAWRGRSSRTRSPNAGPAPLRPLAGVALIAVAVFASWSALQPVRSVHAQAAALDRVDKGQLPAAASIARIAHDRNPLSVDPLFDLPRSSRPRGQHEVAPQRARAGDRPRARQPGDVAPARAACG